MTRLPQFVLELPQWLEGSLPPAGYRFTSDEEKMRYVISLSESNIANNTGGPFGAGIFAIESGELIAPGINLVVPSRWSVGHAEIVAFTLAQQILGTNDLGGPGLPHFELITSTEPCSMCFGATPWSGVTRLVCAARDEDARAIGMDEGPKPKEWVATLEARGIAVVSELLRDEAVAILNRYAQEGGVIYNGRTGMQPGQW